METYGDIIDVNLAQSIIEEGLASLYSKGELVHAYSIDHEKVGHIVVFMGTMALEFSINDIYVDEEITRAQEEHDEEIGDLRQRIMDKNEQTDDLIEAMSNFIEVIFESSLEDITGAMKDLNDALGHIKKYREEEINE